MQTPIATFQSGPVNSLRGAALLTGTALACFCTLGCLQSSNAHEAGWHACPQSRRLFQEIKCSLLLEERASSPLLPIISPAIYIGIQDGIEVDIGGTTTDVGALIGGLPRPAPRTAELAGAPTNFQVGCRPGLLGPPACGVCHCGAATGPSARPTGHEVSSAGMQA